MDGVQEAEHGPGLGLGQTSLCDGQGDDVFAADDVASVYTDWKSRPEILLTISLY